MNRLEHHYDSAPAAPEKQGNMKGFDAEFTDIIDYITRITYRIWEGKQIGLCFDYYSDDCPVYTLAGYTEGAAQVVQNTLNTLSAFPDRTLDADNIIWGGNDIDGFHTSHLIDTKMTNVGDSDLGPATGLKAQFKSPPEARFEQWRQAEIERVSSLELSHRAELPSQTNAEQTVLAVLQNIWNARMMGDVFKYYAEDAALHASANNERHGQAQIVGFYGAFLGSFSDLKVSFDYSCQQASSRGGDNVAVRWTMAGKHSGQGLFGKPTGAPILIIGESQYRIENGKIQEEWTVFDQIAIMVQVARARKQNKRHK